MTESKNSKINQLVRHMRRSLTSVRDDQGLYALLQPALSFNGPIRYDNRWPWAMAIVGGLCLLLLWGLHQGQLAAMAPALAQQLWSLVSPLYQLPLGPWSPFVLLILLGVGIVLARHSRLKGLADAIWHKNLLLDNQLQEVPGDSKAKAKEFRQRFHEFERGNYSRDIEGLCQGHFQGEQHGFDFQLFDFHYVDQHTTTTTDSKGRIQTRTTYTHYHRYGIVLPFGFTHDLNVLGYSISGHRGKSWEPASLAFRKRYTVLAGSEMIAAKFFKPAVVEVLEQLAEQVSKVNLEFNSAAELCITVADADLASLRRPVGLEDAQGFLQLLQQQTRLPKLDKLLHCVHQLMVYSDNNF